MLIRRRLIAALALVMPLMAAAQQNADPLQVLIDQGKYWQVHKRGDLAEQAWQKVLRIDPKQPDALFGMGMVLADRKDGSGAQQYLAQLRQIAPGYPNIDELGRRLGETSARDQTVNDARRLAQSGQNASAVQEYRRAIDGKPSTPELQLEYYQALAATPQGWDEARRGLEQLARQNADDPRYALAYAQHLTYRDATRRDGIDRLARLANDDGVGAQAKKSWRQALLWLGARASDAPLYQAYLQTAPDDAAVKARFDSMVQQDKAARERAQADAAVDARGRVVADGFNALDRGDLVTAQARFSSALTSNPNDADALGGLGVVALRQERFAEARNDLERASRAGNPARWKDALTSATYWTYTSDAIGARSNGQIAQAKALFERAIAVDPSDVTAQTLLGEMLLANGDARGAEQAYRMALRRQADNPDAIRGLVGALAAQGRGDEALGFANRLNAEQQAKAGGIDKLRGEAQAAQARAAEARGDLGAARSLFEDAMLNIPDDPWLRLDLARIYVRQGAVGNARSMMDGLLARHPDMTDALYASALLCAETHDWSAGLAQLDRIPAAQRTAAMTALQHRLWVQQQAEFATGVAASGQRAQAEAILRRAEPVAAGNAELTGAVASAYLKAGDPARGLALVRGAMAQAPNDAGLLLQYAGMLSATNQDAELGAVMRRLASASLTTQQRADFEALNVGIVIRQADAVRLRGDLAAAYDVIAPWLAAMPDNADLQATLGRMYTSAGDDRNALSCYQRALARRPDDVALMTAAMSAASGVREFKLAETLANQAYAGAPNDPGVLAAIGRMYRAQGKLDLAAQYLQRSLLAANTPVPSSARSQSSKVPRDWQSAMNRIGSMPLPGTNPFEGRSAVDVSSSSSSSTFGPGYRPESTYSQPVPNYLPPSQPAPYVAPYVTPYVAPAPMPNGGFGGEDYGSGQSGAPLQAYPDQDPYNSSPWPMSPAVRDAAQANAYAPAIAPVATAKGKRAAPRAYQSVPQAYAQQAYTQQAYTQQPYAQQPYAPQAYAQQPYTQQPYAPQPYMQQPYAQQPYAPQPYTQQPYAQQPYAQQPYAQQPYVPQPPAGYAQPYYPTQARRPPVADAQTAGVAEELAAINREQSSTVSGGIVFRNRNGEDGLSNLNDIEAPIEGRIKAGNGHVVVRATPVTLDAGTASGNQQTLARFGAGSSVSNDPNAKLTNDYGSQTATGVGLSVGYENRNFKGDVGTTPLGFRETNVVGGLQYQNAITDKVSYTLAVARRAVTDSLLSYAGARDAGAGLEWGGVTSSGARADLGWDDGTSGVYANAAYQFLDGKHVATNNAVKGGGGIYTRIIKDADQILTVGANTTLMHYDKNLSYFTYGQGGYFSPQQYVILNFPVEYMGRTGLFSYDLKGSVGVQHYRQDESNYFPLDGDRQSTAAGQPATPDAGAKYPGQSKTGVSYSLNATGEYQLAPQLAVGATASFGNAYQYREWLAAIYVRYSFNRMPGFAQPVFPPQAFSSPYLSLSN